MTRSNTLYAAAAELARPGFPFGQLPRVARMPFVNLGHFVHFDYALFASIVWGTTLDLKQLFTAWKAKRDVRLALAGGLVLSAVITLPLYLAVNPQEAQLVYIASAVMGVVALGILVLSLMRRFELDAAACELRRAAIESMLAGKVPEVATRRKLQGQWIAWGNARLDGSYVPVLTASRGRPFPGFGRVGVEQTFVVPASTDANHSMPTASEIERAIRSRITDAVATAGFRDVRVGEVVVLASESLRLDSAWLDRELQTPLLWAARNWDFTNVDMRASVRAFLAIEILFPQHQTSATLFVRTFASGSGAGVAIAITTLGPHECSDSLLRSRYHDLHESKSVGIGEEPAQTHFGAKLTRWNASRTRNHEFLSLLNDAESAFEPFDQKEMSEMAREGAKLRERLPYWPGNWAELSNWREAKSLTFTNDYFGLPEARAAIRILYEHVSKAALDTLHEQGFDISGYRDKDGQWHVHAEKIDSLVIGEQVVMNARESDKSSAKDDQAKAA